VLFVTHRLDEVVAIASHVSVLRDGVLVADEPATDLDEAALIERILGFSLDQLYPSTDHRPVRDRAIRVERLTGTVAADVALDIGRGEIVGITGLIGMGWEEIPYLLFGSSDGTGVMTIDDIDDDVAQLTPRKAMQRGLALLPADRQSASGVSEATLGENLTLLTVSRYFRGGWLRRRREAIEAEATLSSFDVRPPDPTRKLGTLSGGNQQKALLAKWFATEPGIFMLHEPTHGVDIGAKKQIFARIRGAADAGAAVLIASAEYEDLANLCDRVLVFRDGRVCDELSGSSLHLERIVERCFGAHQARSGS
jgi:ribose transport system ATP-binding protein